MILALCGPSQIGKTYAKEAILRHLEVRELRWYTTKPLEPDEPVGRHMDEDQFARNFKSGKLVLVEEKDGYSYGFSKHDIVRNDVLFVTEMCPSMITEFKKINPDIIAISFVTDSRPSGLDILKSRLKKKSSSKTEFENRLFEAQKELEYAREHYDYFDVSVLVTEKNQKDINRTVLSLAAALI